MIANVIFHYHINEQFIKYEKFIEYIFTSLKTSVSEISVVLFTEIGTDKTFFSMSKSHFKKIIENITGSIHAKNITVEQIETQMRSIEEEKRKKKV